jgi:hypothetical protein
MKRNGERERHYRLKSVDRIEPKSNGEVKVEATYVEDDRPRAGRRGRHEVEGHWEVVNGKRRWVREHDAKNPRR